MNQWQFNLSEPRRFESTLELIVSKHSKAYFNDQAKFNNSYFCDVQEDPNPVHLQYTTKVVQKVQVVVILMKGQAIYQRVKEWKRPQIMEM